MPFTTHWTEITELRLLLLMNFTKHRLLCLFHFTVQHNNVHRLRLLAFAMARSLPIGFFASCLHIRSVLLTCWALCWSLLHVRTIPSLRYGFDASSIVWSLDIPLYMRFNCSTPGAVEMADWWLKDGWHRWLKEGHSLQHSTGELLFYTSVTPPPKFVVLLALDGH